MKEIGRGKRVDGTKETGRIEPFSDGVFAVAITLLVLNIQPPPHDALPKDVGLLKFLGEQWPTYFAFVTSFFTIGLSVRFWRKSTVCHITEAELALFLLSCA